MSSSEWRAAVMASNGGACKDCGAPAEHAHHIKPQATHPELRTDPSNGVPLCRPCHVARHRAEGRPQSRARTRSANRTTMQKIITWQEGRIAELSDSVARLNREVIDLRRRIRSVG